MNNEWHIASIIGNFTTTAAFWYSTVSGYVQQSELQKDPDNEDQEGGQEYDRESDEEEVCPIFIAWYHMCIWGVLQGKWKWKLFSMHKIKITKSVIIFASVVM